MFFVRILELKNISSINVFWVGFSSRDSKFRDHMRTLDHKLVTFYMLYLNALIIDRHTLGISHIESRHTEWKGVVAVNPKLLYRSFPSSIESQRRVNSIKNIEKRNEILVRDVSSKYYNKIGKEQIIYDSMSILNVRCIKMLK